MQSQLGHKVIVLITFPHSILNAQEEHLNLGFVYTRKFMYNARCEFTDITSSCGHFLWYKSAFSWLSLCLLRRVLPRQRSHVDMTYSWSLQFPQNQFLTRTVSEDKIQNLKRSFRLKFCNIYSSASVHLMQWLTDSICSRDDLSKFKGRLHILHDNMLLYQLSHSVRETHTHQNKTQTGSHITQGSKNTECQTSTNHWGTNPNSMLYTKVLKARILERNNG